MQHHGGMLLMNRAVTFSLDIEIRDLMVDSSNFRLIVPLKLNESYSFEAKKDIKFSHCRLF